MADDAAIVFTPSGLRGRFPLGTPVLQAARALGVDVDSVCGGRGICGRCQVHQVEGEFAKHGIVSRSEHLSAFSEVEQAFSARKPMQAGRRLSCTAKIMGDVVIDVPAESQAHRQIVRKAAEAVAIELDPAIRLHYVEVAEPDMHSPASDLRRLLDALEREWQLSSLDCDLTVVQGLQVALRKCGWKVTVAVHDEKSVVAVWPGFKEKAFGVAVDVGSTTISAHLCDLSTGEVVAAVGRMNPQIRFGEDLMSRVSYIMMNPGGETALVQAVRDALNELAGEAAQAAGIERADILETTLVGNPVMHHLLLGINPIELGGAPFALATDRATTLKAAELGLSLHPGARAFVLPCIAGHVGADAAGVVLAERPDLLDKLTLLVDVGTNAEIVLGNRRRLLACSSPTGPAFEGAQISCGQRASPGAIERVRIDPASLEPRFKVIGCDLWSDDPGFAHATRRTGVTGVCGSGIIEALAEMFLAGILRHDGSINGELAARTPRIQPDGATFSYLLHDGPVALRITQNDVRAIQLAKAALHAGARLLMNHMGVEAVDRIRLAGAFGSHIDVKYATVLGMLPDCDLEQVSSAGNAAGTGARIALLDRRTRGLIETLVRRIEKIETAVEPKFQAEFVEAMAIPHASAPYPNLSRVVKLPTPEPRAQARDRAERRAHRQRRAGSA
ncbi:MAG TPA: ASKHA domain-containing protein [Stellaceae bacterium]|nr:ASKHA domain-containing protein [Stellaceae bacterium]